VAGCCEHSNESSGIMKSGVIQSVSQILVKRQCGGREKFSFGSQ
jgi:hypothetical protein